MTFAEVFASMVAKLRRDMGLTPKPVPKPVTPPPISEPIPELPPLSTEKVPLRDLVEPCSEREMRARRVSVAARDEPWIFAGMTSGYQMMYEKHRELLRVIIRRIDERYPRSGNARMVMGDAGGRGRGHSTHNGYDVFDGNYYTLTTDVSEGHNMTHYRQLQMPPIEYLWRGRWTGLIRKKFDKEKNQEILEVLNDVFPRSDIMTFETLKQYLGQKFIQGDWAEGMNHWRHWHITMGMTVNWDALV